jgi:hypothetical protein
VPSAREVIAEPGVLWGQVVDLGARGRYAEADDLALSIGDQPMRWTSLALSTRASHRRQIGAIDEARRLDEEALDQAEDLESRADALIGLAADAIATADAITAARWHGEAEADAGHASRTQTRWHWVGAEYALLMGDDSAARTHARAAVEVGARVSTRHQVKSRIVEAAVTGAVADLADVQAVIDASGWWTLAWPLALVAADHPGRCDPAWLAVAWTWGRGATFAIERHLRGDHVEIWRSHPGVRRLRGDGGLSGGG